MTADQGRPGAGSIYDLGYRHYDGVRLGRQHAVWTLYWDGLRAVFGIGRRVSAKILPFGLGAILLLPALVQLGIAAALPERITVIKPEEYFNLTQVIIFLFCAAVAPELVGRDQRAGTLSLYFSRGILRWDYAGAKLAALTTSLFLIVILPQAVLFAGSCLASNDSLAYVRANWQDVPVFIGAGFVVSAFMASISLGIASQSPRRAYATVAVLAFFLFVTVVGGILFQTLTGDWKRYCVLLNPLSDVDGLVFWMFGTAPRSGSAVAYADFSGLLYLAVLLAAAGAGLLVFLRRYQRVSA